MVDENIVVGDVEVTEDVITDLDDAESGDDNDVEVTGDTEENGDFDPDEFDGTDDNYVIGAYDVSKYKESLNLEDNGNYDSLTAYLTKMESIGLTQEQVEFMLELEDADDDKVEEPKAPTKAEVQAKLKKELTREEANNYKSINSYVSNMLAGSDLEVHRNEIMTNPNLVKIMNLAYKNSIGANKTGTLDNKSKRVEKQIRSMGFDDAMAQIKQTMVKKGDTKALAKQLSGVVSDKEKFAQMMAAMGIN